MPAWNIVYSYVLDWILHTGKPCVASIFSTGVIRRGFPEPKRGAAPGIPPRNFSLALEVKEEIPIHYYPKHHSRTFQIPLDFWHLIMFQMLWFDYFSCQATFRCQFAKFVSYVSWWGWLRHRWRRFVYIFHPTEIRRHQWEIMAVLLRLCFSSTPWYYTLLSCLYFKLFSKNISFIMG